ncbi:transmembrane reductase CYB561D2-like isoform X2 [Armigeres subalbatus]|uniref:transmembrane reductase CYB561D2-like isoform X2 n=1 Tax=Armigeres subalbatus TaxID=124917 RepID=UPI002ED674FF
MADSLESGDPQHRSDSETQSVHNQVSDNRKRSSHTSTSDCELISEPAMDEVEADEIISAADGFGTATRTQSATNKQQVYGKNSTTTRTAQQQQPKMSKKLLLVNLLANFLMFAIAGFITYHCFNKATVLFSWHPSLMSIGYFILMSQAVLTLSGANLLTYRKHQKTRVFVHWILQALAGILITIASVCIFLNKVRMGKAHYQTVHAIVGLITVILTLLSIAGGIFTKYGYQLRHLVRPINSKIMHGIAGVVTYIMGSVTIGLGVYSAWFQEDNDGHVRLALLIGIIAVTLYVIINPIAATISRTKTALRSTL